MTTIRKTLWAWTLSTFFGAGYLKPGPGTYGSIFAVLLWYAAASLFAPTPAHLALATALAAVVITLIGIPASTITAREALRKDPGFVVIDEVAGQLFALILAHPTGSTRFSTSSSSASSTSSSPGPSAPSKPSPPAPASCSTT